MQRRHLIMLATVALLARIVYNALVLHDYSPLQDADHYHSLATNVAAGDGLSHTFPFLELHATAFRPPLYPLLLGGMYWLFGSHLVVAQILNIVLGTAVVLLIAHLAHTLAGPPAGLVAGGLAAVFPPLLANDGPPLTEPLGLTLLLGGIALLVAGRVGAAGAIVGLLVLTRPSAQGFAAVLAIWLLWRLGWRKAVTFAAVVGLVIAPWALRNWVEFGRPVLVTSNGFNLVALYSEPSFIEGHWQDPIFDDRFASVRGDADDELELDRRFREEAFRSMRAEPTEVLRVIGQNVRDFIELDPARQDNAERSDGRHIPFRNATIPLVWLTIIAGIAGLVTLRRTRAAEPLLISTVYFFLVSLPFTPGAPRLRAPIDVALCIGVGVAYVAYVAGQRASSQSQLTPTTAGSRSSI